MLALSLVPYQSGIPPKNFIAAAVSQTHFPKNIRQVSKSKLDHQQPVQKLPTQLTKGKEEGRGGGREKQMTLSRAENTNSAVRHPETG